jgi:hypothetical protein
LKFRVFSPNDKEKDENEKMVVAGIGDGDVRNDVRM